MIHATEAYTCEAVVARDVEELIELAHGREYRLRVSTPDYDTLCDELEAVCGSSQSSGGDIHIPEHSTFEGNDWAIDVARAMD